MDNLIIAILILPLIGFLINGLFGKHLPKVVVGGLATLVVLFRLFWLLQFSPITLRTHLLLLYVCSSGFRLTEFQLIFHYK